MAKIEHFPESRLVRKTNPAAGAGFVSNAVKCDYAFAFLRRAAKPNSPSPANSMA